MSVQRLGGAPSTPPLGTHPHAPKQLCVYYCRRLRQLKTARKLLRDFNTAAKVELEQQVAAGQVAVQQLLQLRQDLDAAYACIRCGAGATAPASAAASLVVRESLNGCSRTLVHGPQQQQQRHRACHTVSSG